MSLHRFVYLSHASRPFDEDTFHQVLEISRKNNARDHVTGLLLYHEGSILQVLEGERAALNACYYRISRDHRHHTCRLLVAEPSVSHIFPDWQMARFGMSDLEVAQRNQFLNLQQLSERLAPDTLKGDPAVAAILLAFMSGLRQLSLVS